MCVVVWYRNNKKNETLIPTPVNNEQLRQTMLTQHKVGYSELRTVKAVDAQSLTSQINFGNISHRRMAA